MDFEKDWIIKTKISEKNIENIITDIDNIVLDNNLISNTEGKSASFNAKQYDLDKFLDNNLSLNKIKNIVEESLLKSNIIDCGNSLLNISKWTVIGNEGCYHAVHKHNLLRSYDNSSISTVTYLKVQQKEKSDSRSGNFYAFFRENRIVTLSPKIGDVFIFPTWLYHGTYPQSKGVRQTLNMDFSII